jgi:segregation and condensation protein B
MTEETHSEIAEALQAVGEKTGGEVALEAAEAAAADGEVADSSEVRDVDAGDSPSQQQQPFNSEQLEALGIEEKPADTESERHRLRAMIEAAVYVSEEPLTVMQMSQALSQPKEVVESLLAELIAAYAEPHHGIAVREVAGGFKMSTKPEFHEDIRSFVKKLKPPLKLSLAALETLAVVAYKQPVTGPEILEIRGVQGGGVLKTLLERKLITAAGRKQVVGKPVLYKTTKDFLVQFGLKDLAELPTLKEFEEWSRLALGDDAGETPVPAAAAIEPAPPDTVVETPEAPAHRGEPAGE